MHVVLVSHIFWPHHRAGVETYTAQVAKTLAAHAEVTVVTTRKVISLKTGTIRDYSVGGIDVVEVVNNLDHDGPEGTWSHPLMERAFDEVIERLRPDLVHLQHVMYWSAALPQRLDARGIATVMTLHDFWLQCGRMGQLVDHRGATCPGPSEERCPPCLESTPWGQSDAARRWIRRLAMIRRFTGIPLDEPLRRLERLRTRDAGAASPPPPDTPASPRWISVYRERREAFLEMVGAVDLFVTPSESLRQSFTEWGIAPERIRRHPQGLDHSRFTNVQPTPGDGALRLGYLGTIAPHKGVDVLLRAVSRLDPERVRLEVRGPTAPPEHYVRTCEALAEAAPAITMAGPLPPERVPDAYREIDVLCVPSVWNECCPLTIQEAQMAGVPVVTSGFGGMAELVRDGVDGLHARPGDVEDWERVLRKLVEEDGLVERLRSAAPGVPTLEEHVEGLLEIYREVRRE